ncbi:MAG: signal peptide peptidase SppA, partial [Gammaproteobacteria bacterium]|nr:signal peptide peptidase SppA [Gammaproteobacteria bacterium]
MKKFFSAIGKILGGLVKFLQAAILLLFIGIWVVALSGKQVVVPDSTALVLAPAGQLTDQLEGDAFERALAAYEGQSETQALVKNIIDSLHMAEQDDRVKSLVLDLGAFAGGSLAQMQRVGDAIDQFKASGKPVIVSGDGFTQAQYYLAARADEIYMHDLGAIFIEGYGYYRTFLKDAIENLEVDVNVFRVGEYKSFVEPYLRNTMSEADKRAANQWLEALWIAYRDDVESARELEPGTLDVYANTLGDLLLAANGDTAVLAYEAGLIDDQMSHQEFEDYMSEIVGESDDVIGYFEGIHYLDYLSAVGRPNSAEEYQTNVAVLVASGTIVDGMAPPGTVGGETLAELIREATMDDGIAAVVLQIDSPGGSMFASEVVFDQLEYLQASGKPFVVSMSGVAASGGYYIAMLADEIFASETTITGSIGVGAIVPTFQRSLAKLGVNIDGFGTTVLAGQFDPMRELGPDAREFLTLSVESAYDIFVSKVAESRDMSFERADSIARGRVWIGSDALDLGLIDKIGTLDDAIVSAATLAGMEPESYGVRYIDMELSPAEVFVLELAGGIASISNALDIRWPRASIVDEAVL